MRREKPLKLGNSSGINKAPAPSSSAAARSMRTRRAETLSMPARTRQFDVTPGATVRPQLSKAEIYAALFGLNAGIQQFLSSLDCLDRAGLGLPFLNGYRILADEIRSAINFSTTEAMTVVELRDYEELENQRSKFSFPPNGSSATEPKNCDRKP